MSEFSLLSVDSHIRRRFAGEQQQQTASVDAAQNSTQRASAGHSNIQLPSFRQVQAAQRPAHPPNTFAAARLPSTNSQHQQQQQQQPETQVQRQQRPQSQQQQQQDQQQRQQHRWQQRQQQQQPREPGMQPATSITVTQGPALGLGLQLPRYNQSAGAAAGAPVGAVRVFQDSHGLPGSWASQQQQQQQRLNSGSMPPANTVLVSQRQQGNPVLKHIRTVRWTFADVVPDYICGSNTAILFLSLRYHLLQPEYVLHRLKAVQRGHRLTILLLLVDVDEVVKPLQELHRAAMGADAVLICAWSNEECARYIETFKAYESRPASSIMERTDMDYLGRLIAALTSVRGINKSDAFMLASRSGSLAEVIKGKFNDFASCPGLGPIKARRLVDAFNLPFKKTLGPSIVGGVAAVPNSQPGAGMGQQANQQVQQQQQQQQSQVPIKTEPADQLQRQQTSVKQEQQQLDSTAQQQQEHEQERHGQDAGKAVSMQSGDFEAGDTDGVGNEGLGDNDGSEIDNVLGDGNADEQYAAANDVATSDDYYEDDLLLVDED